MAPTLNITRLILLLSVSALFVVQAQDYSNEFGSNERMIDDENDDSLSQKAIGGVWKGIKSFQPIFLLNKEYNYKYDSQISSSLTQADQFAITRLRANVKLQIVEESAEGEKTAVVKCDRIQLSMAQKSVGIQQQQQPMVEFEQLERKEIGQSLQDTIKLPFIVKITKQGRITKLQFSEEDQHWSENLKRSMINALQVVAQRKSDDKKEAEKMESKKSSSSSEENRQPASYSTPPLFFTQMEQTIEGDCEMAYVITKNVGGRRRQSSAGSLNVTKTVNFSKCLARPELRYNFHRNAEEFLYASGIGGGRASLKKQAIDVSTVYDIEVGTGNFDNEEFVVLRSQVSSRLSHNLLDSEHIAMITFAKTQMRLTDVVAKQPSMEWPKPAVNSEQEPLMHSLKQDEKHEKFITEGDAKYLAEGAGYPSTEKLPEIAVNTMRQLMKTAGIGSEKSKKLEMSEETAKKLEQFVGLVRLADQKQLQLIRQKLAPLVQTNTDSSYRNSKFIKDMFVDSLTLSCTLPSLETFASLIQSKHLTHTKAARSLVNLHQCRRVGDQQLDTVWKLCESAIARQHSSLRQSCLLSWGVMVNSACASNRANISVVVGYGKEERKLSVLNDWVMLGGGHSDSDKWALEQQRQNEDINWKPETGGAEADYYCTKSKKKELVEKIMEIYKRAPVDDSDAKITVLKALGNMGVTSSIIELEKIIQSQEEEPIVRIQAIDALRHIAHQIPHKVQRICLPIFQDRREKTEIRLNALYQLLHSQPERPVMDVIVSEMSQETNAHVKAFLQSSIKEMIASRSHFDKQTAQILKSTMESLKIWDAVDSESERRSASKLHQHTWFSTPSGNSQSHHGMGITWGAIFGRSSHLPKELMASLDQLIDGRLLHSRFQIGIHQQDIEAAMQKIAEAIDSKTFDQMIVRNKRAAPAASDFSSRFSSYNPYEMLKSFINKHKLFGGSKTEKEARPELLIYTRHNGMDTHFTLLTEQSLAGLLNKEGQMDIGRMESSSNATDQLHHHYSASMGDEWKVKMVSVAGIPLVLHSRQPTLKACEGMTRLEFEPFGSEKVRGARVTTNVQPQINKACILSMESYSPLFTSGVQTQHSVLAKLPLNFQIKASTDGVTGAPSAELEIQLPTKDTTLLQLHSRAATFQRVWPVAEKDGQSEEYVDTTEKTLYLQTLEEEHAISQYEIRCPISGLTYQMRGHWPQGILAPGYGIDWLLAGENSMEMRALPSKSPLAAKRLRFKLSLRTTPTDNPLEKTELLKLFDTRPELFAGSKPEEVSVLRHFLQSFNPRMNFVSRLRLTVMAEQTPQERKLELEANALCDGKATICAGNAIVGYKQSQASASTNNAIASANANDEEMEERPKRSRGRRALGSQGYQLSSRFTFQFARPILSGVYPGGAQSSHHLYKVEQQLEQTINGQPKLAPQTVTLSGYAKPSKLQQLEWSSLLESAQNYADVRKMSSVMRANDLLFVAEYQSTTPTCDYLRSCVFSYTHLGRMFAVTVTPHLEETLSKPATEEQLEHSTLYARLIADLHPNGLRPLYNLTLSDEPMAVGAGNMKMVKGKFVKPMTKGSHVQIMNWNKEEQELVERMVKSGQRMQKPASLMEVINGQESEQYAECRMKEGRYVKSFDGKQYTIPLTSCYTILAEDSASQPRSYIVTAKKSANSGKTHLRIQLAMTSRLYEMTPGASGKQMIVRVNNVVVDKANYEEYGIRSYGEDAKLTYVVECDKCGIKVEFDGVNIWVGLSNKYVNKQHGVCGHYNHDSVDELMVIAAGGEKREVNDLRGFHAYFVEKEAGGECDPKSVVERIKAGNSNNDDQDDDSYTYIGSMRRQIQKKLWRDQPSESSAEVQRQIDELEMEKKDAEKKRKEEKAKEARKALEHRVNMKSGNMKGAKSWEDDFLQPKINNSPSPWEMSEEEDQGVADEFSVPKEQKGSAEWTGRRRGFGPHLVTKMIEKPGAVCFSRQPIRQCPEGSRARFEIAGSSGQQKKQVEFLCMPRNSFEAKRLMNEKRNSTNGRIAVVLSESQEEQQQHQIKQMEIVLPKECIAY